MTPEEINIIITALVQVPYAGAMIYLVLKLEDKRQNAIKARDEIHRHTIDGLLALIDELASRNSPDRVTARQLRSILRHMSKNKIEPEENGENGDD